MGGRNGVPGRAARRLFCKTGREPLIEAVHGDFRCAAKRCDELLGLRCLGTVVTAESHGHPDHDPLHGFLARERKNFLDTDVCPG